MNSVLNAIDLQIGSVKLMRNMKQPEKDVLWIGMPKELQKLLDSGTDIRGLLIAVSSGATERQLRLASEKGATITAYDADLTDLYDSLSSSIIRHMDWKLRMTEATARNYSMRDVVTECAKIAQGAAFFIDRSFHVAYFGGSSALGSQLAKNLLSDDIVSSEKFRALLQNTSGQDIIMRRLTNGDYSWSTNVSLDSTEPFYIVLLTPDESKKSEIPLLLELLRESFTAINMKRKHGDLPLGDFKALMQSMISGDLSTWDDIEAYTKRLPSPPKRFITMAAASTNPSMRRISQETFMSKLVTFFPGCSCTALDDLMVLMISDETRKNQPRPAIDEKALEQLLNEYDGYIAFSNATQILDMIRTNYMLAESTLRLGRAIRETNSRIFYYEDYAEYISIELTLERFKSILGHDDLVFLTNPDAVTIYRYDQQNGTDLLNVLYQYCKNNGSISDAARDAYMHRNTFASRLSEIKSILKDVDISDGKVQHRLLFSCKVFRYYNFYYDKKASRSLSERLSPMDRS